ncbi:MAG: hypothetical protein HRT74_08915, partial [Flavobacteriales bacterium]|nr:hypothetical protein [Flavobacteriales bacterium]
MKNLWSLPLLILLFWSCNSPAESDTITPLNLSANWSAMSSGVRLDSLQIPFSYAYACHEQKRFPHPHAEGAEQFYKLLERDPVTFENSFILDANSELVGAECVMLELNRVDTYGEILLNGKEVGKTNNAHRTFSFDVAPLLKPGENIDQSIVTSPLVYHQETVNGAPFELPSGCEEGLLNVGCYTRKPQYQFGWDWGPRIVSPSLGGQISLSITPKATLDKVLSYTESINFNPHQVKQHLSFEVNGDCKD